MHKTLLPLTAAVLVALGIAGCESTNRIAARAQEKSAVYATLKTWEKKYLEKGTVAVGFTPDMVYIALGHPTKTEVRDFPDGRAELWTYSRAYPNADAIRGFKRTAFTVQSAYQSSSANNQAGPAQTLTPAGLNQKNPPTPDHGGNDSISKTGGPQGGSMEPADLGSYTIQVLFENGQVARLSAVPNTN